MYLIVKLVCTTFKLRLERMMDQWYAKYRGVIYCSGNREETAVIIIDRSPTDFVVRLCHTLRSEKES